MGRSRLLIGAALVFCLLLTGGCGKIRHSVEHVNVTGTVKYKGQPVKGGKVAFVTVEGAFASTGVIDPTGKYTISSPEGEVRISVDNRMLNKQDRGNKQDAARKGAGRPDAGEPDPVKGVYQPLPTKVYSTDTSGLTYIVTKDASQTFDIEIKD
jgi:hypothetical protein